MSILVGSSYKPARGGHAPGDVRDAFLSWLADYYDAADNAPTPMAELREQEIEPAKLLGLLWNCTDQMPGIYVGMVEDILGDQPIRGTYASAVRALKETVR
jgi:hypothetical protein